MTPNQREIPTFSEKKGSQEKTASRDYSHPGECSRSAKGEKRKRKGGLTVRNSDSLRWVRYNASHTSAHLMLSPIMAYVLLFPINKCEK